MTFSHITGYAKGCIRTALPGVAPRYIRTSSPEEQAVGFSVPDERFGAVKLTGIYGELPGATTLVVILPGLGGHGALGYCYRAALAARTEGVSSLRLSCRGTDRSGEDLFHPALTRDLASVIHTFPSSQYTSVILFGFSLGGTYAIRAGIDAVDPRLMAIVAASPPLDIPASVDALDQRGRLLCRRHILSRLHRCYAALDARKRAPAPLEDVRRTRTLREFDELTLTKRFGFPNTTALYSAMDLKERIERVRTPLLILASDHDPVVSANATRTVLRRAPACVTTRWVNCGGHMHLKPNLHLGYGIASGWERQAISWAKQRCAQ